MFEFWGNRRVLVTGGAGFIGSHLVRMLANAGAKVTATAYGGESVERLADVRDRISIRNADLTRLEDCLAVCEGQDAVFSIAHVDGSVEFKQSRPASILRQNVMITLNLLEAAHCGGAERFLLTSSAEVYPLSAPSPCAESPSAWDLTDRPADGYAWSKRISEMAVRTFVHEHGMKVAIARPNNVYGPGDYFDSQRGRVIPRFIQQVLHGSSEIVIWGTGEMLRTFLYVEDLCRGFLLTAEKHPAADAINLSGEEEVSIRDLAAMVARLCGRDVRIVCDAAKPSGALRRKPDTTKARQLLGFVPQVSLEAGLRMTIDSYRDQLVGKTHDAGSAG